MLKNNNGSAVRRIALRSIKQNRVRNRFVVVAVILTTFMLTTVFTIGISLAEGMMTLLTRQQGTRSAIYLYQPSAEQIAQVNECSRLYAVGIQIEAGNAYVGSNEDTSLLLSWYDKTEFDKNYKPAISDIHGSYPQAANEIMLSKRTFEPLGITKPKIGMEIKLSLESGEKTFRLSGWFTDYTAPSEGFQCFVSKAYCDENGLTAEKDSRLSISSKIGQQEKLMNELDESVTLRGGQDFDFTTDMLEETISNRALIALLFGIIGFIIVFSSYLLIYNVMYISVTKDIRFYGMLKTLGTTPKQIRRIVRIQIFTLSATGIPAGLLLGTLVSFKAVPLALKMYNDGGLPLNMKFHPSIYIAVLLFVFITIVMSCRKPSKLASGISPINAMKYNGLGEEKVKARKSTDGGKLRKIAFRNVFREKKRAIVVFASLFMGTMAFLSVNTFIDCLDPVNYAKHYVKNDFTITPNGVSTAAGATVEDVEQEKDAVAKLIEKIKGLKGITNMTVTKCEEITLDFDRDVYMPFLESEAYGATDLNEFAESYEKSPELYTSTVIYATKEEIEKYNEKGAYKIDVDKFEAGEICVVGVIDDDAHAKQMIGKTISMTDRYGDGKLKMEIGSCISEEDAGEIEEHYLWQTAGAPGWVLVSESAFGKLTDRPQIEKIALNCEPKDEKHLNEELRGLVNACPQIALFEEKTEVMKQFEQSLMSLKVLGSGFSLVLVLIGVINFVNVMLTGVYTRRQELAVMESVGMTKKQVLKMLMLEGIYYAEITLALILTLGSGLIVLVGKITLKLADYAIFSYPYWLIAVLSGVILVICAGMSAIVYKAVSKESITERMRITD